MSAPAVLGRLYLGLILIFLYAPIGVMALMSFNASEFYQLPVQFSTVWYERLLRTRRSCSRPGGRSGSRWW